jgi:hypothetical protein
LFQNELVQTPLYFGEQAQYLRASQKNVHFSAVLEYIMTYLENNSEYKRRPLNRLLPRKKIIVELKQWTNGGTTKRMGNLSSAFGKANS